MSIQVVDNVLDTQSLNYVNKKSLSCWYGNKDNEKLYAFHINPGCLMLGHYLIKDEKVVSEGMETEILLDLVDQLVPDHKPVQNMFFSYIPNGQGMHPHIDHQDSISFYLNKDWNFDCGGHFEYYDEKIEDFTPIEFKSNRAVFMKADYEGQDGKTREPHRVGQVNINSNVRRSVQFFFDA